MNETALKNLREGFHMKVKVNLWLLLAGITLANRAEQEIRWLSPAVMMLIIAMVSGEFPHRHQPQHPKLIAVLRSVGIPLMWLIFVSSIVWEFWLHENLKAFLGVRGLSGTVDRSLPRIFALAPSADRHNVFV